LEIFVKALSETVPVHRFQHLVRKRKFEEADEFAKRFQLDRQSVLKAKLIVLLQDEHPDQHLQEILGFLAEIQVGGISLFFSVTLSLSDRMVCAVVSLRTSGRLLCAGCLFEHGGARVPIHQGLA